MPDIPLKDILIGARQEAYRMRHFFIGAEHFFIAMLMIRGSLLNSIVQEHGLTSEYVIEAIRRKTGKGSRHRLWAGVPNTPRAQMLLSIANDLALENGREEISERDLLVAIFEENDNIPVRALNALGIKDIAALVETTRTYTLNRDSQRPYVKVDFGDDFAAENELSREQLLILRRAFYGYGHIRIERWLTGGYSGASLLIVTPIRADDREDSPVVVKIDHVDAILDEARRYESLVKSKLPAMTARLEDKPVTVETSNLAAIKYTLVAGYDGVPQDLRAMMHHWSGETLGSWLKKELFPVFGRIWWQQTRPYRFQAWQEYDWLLPPILTLEWIKDTKAPPGSPTLRLPIKRSKLQRMEYGDIITVENFVVQKVYPERNAIQLAVGHGTDAARAYKIEVREVDLTGSTHYRGEVIEKLVGRIWKTRSEILVSALRALEPDFDPAAETIPTHSESPEYLPNPLLHYDTLLDTYVSGSLCTIHGDLHPGNIMVGPNNSAFLIDFAHTRDGHAVFDWAALETSLLSDAVMPTFGSSWDDARVVLQQMIRLNQNTRQPDKTMPVAQSLDAIVHIRDIVKDCLTSNNTWAEYFVALAFCGLRAITWETMPAAGRRLLFLISALALYELHKPVHPRAGANHPASDITDLHTTE
jgi:hypothetical protein